MGSGYRESMAKSKDKWVILKKILGEKDSVEVWGTMFTQEHYVIQTVKRLRDAHPSHYFWYQLASDPLPEGC